MGLFGNMATPAPNMMQAIQNARALYQQMQNPQAFVQQYMPFVPPEFRNDPNAILQFLLNNNYVNQGYINQLQSMAPTVQSKLGF